MNLADLRDFIRASVTSATQVFFAIPAVATRTQICVLTACISNAQGVITTQQKGIILNTFQTAVIDLFDHKHIDKDVPYFMEHTR